jgi:hypothetical protein
MIQRLVKNSSGSCGEEPVWVTASQLDDSSRHAMSGTFNAQGCHQLCKLMHMPRNEAYDAALHMLSYLHGQRDRGIRFNSKGDTELLALLKGRS